MSVRAGSQIRLPARPGSAEEAARLGDVVPAVMTAADMAAYEDPPGSGLYPELASRRVVLVDQDSGEFGLMFAMPDYANMETVNRIPANNGSWAADRTGFVSVIMSLNNLNADPAGWILAYVVVNGKDVTFSQMKREDGSSLRFMPSPIPVSKGDVVSLHANVDTNGIAVLDAETVMCRFIPPRLVSERVPAVAGEFLNYVSGPDFTRQADTGIDALGKSWTAIDNGFVRAMVVNSSVSGTSWILINGTAVGSTGMTTGAFCDLYPVMKGDVVSVEADGSTASLVQCTFYYPRFARSPDSGDKELLFPVPDFDNMDTVSRISANNGTWTAERAGYVSAGGFKSDPLGGNIFVYVNDRQACSMGVMSVMSFQNLIPVAAGDVVRVYCDVASSSWVCYFIPPKFVSPSGAAAVERMEASVSFASPTDVFHAVLPTGIKAMHVYNKYTDSSGPVALKVAPASGGTALTVSESSALPTDVSALAGLPAAFTVSGMAASAAVAVFGVRMR
ncbi:MAG: hypothetical protein LBW85_01195 [Deltaproteobacteria bacterium]|jgi:hypothetical protein|nr:hypothetical protein [Deltaproteobacteria bacterium]